jgi:hypothetical protein
MGKLPCEFKQTGRPITVSYFGFYRLLAPCTILPLSQEPSTVQAMIWYVNSATGSDAHDGRSASTAFKTLAHAVNAAKEGDTILIVPGSYDQDLPAQVSAARGANIVVSVAGA